MTQPIDWKKRAEEIRLFPQVFERSDAYLAGVREPLGAAANAVYENGQENLDRASTDEGARSSGIRWSSHHAVKRIRALMPKADQPGQAPTTKER